MEDFLSPNLKKRSRSISKEEEPNPVEEDFPSLDSSASIHPLLEEERMRKIEQLQRMREIKKTAEKKVFIKFF